MVAAVAVAAAWALVFEVPRLVGLVAANPGGNDFRLFYLAAEIGLHRGWPHIYDVNYLNALSSAMGEGNDIKPAYTYANPPLIAFMTAPLSALQLSIAFYVWAAISVSAFAGACWLAASRTGFARVAILLASLALWPTIYAVERGQPVLLTFAAAVTAWWMAARNRQVEAGLLLALSWALKPQDVLLLPIAFVVSGYRRAALWWLLGSAMLWSAFALILGPNGVGTYLGTLAWVETSPQHLADTYAVIVGSGLPFSAAEAAMLGLTILAMWRQRANWDMAFAIALLGTVMGGFHIHEYDYVAIICAGWLVLRHPVGRVQWLWLGTGVAAFQVLSIGDRLPILLWQPVWCVMLGLQHTVPKSSSSTRSGQRDMTAASVPIAQ